MKKILVTGAAGHIGAECTRHLRGQGYDVVGVDNYSDYYSPEYKLQRVRSLDVYKNIINQDLSELHGLEEIFIEHKPEIVIHLAAKPGVRTNFSDSEYYETQNIICFRNVIKLSKKYKVEKYIYASSSSVYSNLEKVPYSESQEIVIPKSYYALTKLANENIARMASNNDFKTVGLRFFTVYGSWARPDMAIMQFAANAKLNLKANLFGSLLNSRDFTHVTDVVKVISDLVETVNLKANEIFNITSSTPHTLQEVLGILDQYGLKPELEALKARNEDPEKIYGSNAKLKEYGFHIPNISLEAGLGQFCEWLNSKTPEELIVWLS
jgi:UDP-glucuronate 4-epimerase